MDVAVNVQTDTAVNSVNAEMTRISAVILNRKAEKQMDADRVERDMFDTMWAFLQMGNQKANYPALKDACMELRQMMMQKTAGQRKDRKKDIPFENLARIKNTIIIEAMALVLSGEFEKSDFKPKGDGENGED